MHCRASFRWQLDAGRDNPNRELRKIAMGDELVTRVDDVVVKLPAVRIVELNPLLGKGTERAVLRNGLAYEMTIAATCRLKSVSGGSGIARR